ncbi:hypothetical protein VPH35_088822 [Triticum aestivum]
MILQVILDHLGTISSISCILHCKFKKPVSYYLCVHLTAKNHKRMHLMRMNQKLKMMIPWTQKKLPLSLLLHCSLSTKL